MATTEKPANENAHLTSLVPPTTVENDNPKAGPGQKVVTSPTGTKSVVEEDAAALLKTQGYSVG